MNGNIKQVLDLIIEKFKTGEIPQAVAMAGFPIAYIPSSKWSLLNRLVMFLSGTSDARGMKQWNQAGRFVRKGSKSIYILVPCFRRRSEKGEDDEVLAFIKASPVFRFEDTEGREQDYQKIPLPDLPLLDRAREWGISVRAIPGNYRYWGYYAPKRKEIALATPEERTFFHEISHAAHAKVKGAIKPEQDPFQEIVAELSAQALCRLVGKQAKETMGNSYEYIERYAKELKLSPVSACLRVLNETEKVLNMILKGRNNDELITA